ncbi:hypothetical protein GCM10020367_18990 [Streptomyces sannanensis]|uniref:Secreted protein n=1 Tax=Streptomyces sannanensis TaxID=285536 RepID=A0ABP6S8H7_9ACTN
MGITRPMALLGAVATLLAALFICLAPGGHADATTDGHHITLAHTAPEYDCPDERGDCGLSPRNTQAVLTAPSLDTPASDTTPPVHIEAPPRAGGVFEAVVRPRAPGLHVLQVLRI